MPVRLDFGRLGKVERTPQGGLLVGASLTRVGVFPYRRADGSIVREFRPAEEVFAPASLATLRNAPVTDKHPPVMVTPENFSQYAGGHVDGDAVQENEAAVGKLAIQRKDLVDGVIDGTRVENSCGYECDIDETPGTFEGQAYDVIQRRIRYNHVGIGPSGWGRQGPTVALRLDSVDAVQVLAPEARSDGGFPMKIRVPKIEWLNRATLRIDGVAHDMRTPAGRSAAMQAVVNAHAAMRTNARTDGADPAAITAALGDLLTAVEGVQQQVMAIANSFAEEETAEGDPAAAAAPTGQVDQTAADAGGAPAAGAPAPAPAGNPAQPAAVPATDQAKMDAKWASYVATREKAQALAPNEKFDGKSEREIMIAALGVAFPGVRFDSASDEYVRGTFNAAHVRNDAADASFAVVAGSSANPRSRTDGKGPDVEKAKSKARQDSADGWKKPLGPKPRA